MNAAVAALAAVPIALLFFGKSAKASAAASDVSRRMAEAIATGDPAVVRTLAGRLRIEGATEQAAELERVALVLAAKPGASSGAAPVVAVKPSAPVGPIVLNTKGIQQRLIALGYPLGSSGADGIMGPATMAAVKAFQTANGLTVDGIPGPATQAKLQDPNAKGPAAAVVAPAPAAKPAPAPAAKPAPAPAPAKAAAPAPMTTQEIQLRLISLGYSVGSKGADGVMGTNTAAAVRLFQSVNGLTVDGVPGPATQAKLRDPTAKGPAAAVNVPKAAPAPAPAPAPKTAAAPAPAPAATAPAGGRAPTITATLRNLTTLLRNGAATGYRAPASSGQAVTDWQQVLLDLGFVKTKPDGKFGPATEAATRAFQTAANAAGARSGKKAIAVDGIVGPATIARAAEARIMPSGPATFTGDEMFGDVEPLRVPPRPLPATPLPGLMPPMAPVEPDARRALASRLYNMLELAPRGGEDRTLVARYQAQEGLKPTGYYGPATALSLAQSYGIVPPKPLYWTESRTSKSKSNYRDAMRMFGERDPQRSEEWNRAGAV